MPKRLPDELRDLQLRVEAQARAFGLDMFETSYEMLDFDEINMVASYMGFPVRYPHWKWGMEYERMSKSYEYGLHKIYEMVINNNPCYAYLLESNAFVDQKLVMCHVCGHNDFFKNNIAFQHTNRKMMDEMANHATRVERYTDWYGSSVVEGFIDRVLSLDNLIDPSSAPNRKRADVTGRGQPEPPPDARKLRLLPTDREYMERYINPASYVAEQKQKLLDEQGKRQRFPAQPERDVLAFLMEHAPLQPWQVDVIDMLREEAYYFLPQAQTKIMNEGWASYWHNKLMTERMILPSETIDYAERHSGVMAMSPTSLNPYKLGIELFHDIEDRWNKGRFGKEWNECDDMALRRQWDKQTGLGRQKIFQVRQTYTDVMFVDEFFTHDFCQRLGFFSYEYDKKKKEFVIDSRDFQAVKQKILQSLTNGGQPIIRVVDGNHENRSELLLEHKHNGADLDGGYAQETMRNLHAIWSRPVHIMTASENKPVVLSFDGTTCSVASIIDANPKKTERKSAPFLLIEVPSLLGDGDALLEVDVLDGVEQSHTLLEGFLKRLASRDEAHATRALVDDGGAHGFGHVGSAFAFTTRVDQRRTPHVATSHLVAGEVDGVVGGELLVHGLVGLAERNRVVATIVVGQLLLDDVGLDGHTEVVCLTGEVGTCFIANTIFFEPAVAHVTPQHGDHAKLVGAGEGLAHFL
jgi:stage V sporulation protein R